MQEVAPHRSAEGRVLRGGVSRPRDRAARVAARRRRSVPAQTQTVSYDPKSGGSPARPYSCYILVSQLVLGYITRRLPQANAHFVLSFKITVPVCTGFWDCLEDFWTQVPALALRAPRR